ncbi:hypothetical protein Ahy_B06g080061 [Arachis hypogaea]|uniref:HMA domain-containing protein n=2 Tax=Arachis hypogaea TaxID=3818 RepID=A0A444YGZ5_ARAHY|nr:hypothetical protein Ahy_B06g080061 [Arachis hypogaea]
MQKKKTERGENNVVLKLKNKVESDTGKITVTGKDPAKMKEKVDEKLNNKVLLISPQIKKDKNNKNGNHNQANKTDGDNTEKKFKEKEKETPVMTTAVLKVALPCEGCVDKTWKTVSKTKGVNEMEINKDTVTVKGIMDVKALAANLTEKLKRKVEVVPPKKPADKKNNGGGSGVGKKNGGDGKNMAAPHVPFPSTYGYGYAPPVMHPHNHGGYSYMPVCNEQIYHPSTVYPEQFHLHAPPLPPQILSDENPLRCQVILIIVMSCLSW